MTGPPKPYPCASCPYRCDVPSGVWAEEEYAKLPEYDRSTPEQPMGVFVCHQQDDTVCSGWAGTHDGEHLIALRMAVVTGSMSPEDVDATIDYVSPVPLFESGTAAAAHGLADMETPPPEAARIWRKIENRRDRRAG